MLPLMKTRSAESDLVAVGAKLQSRSVSATSNGFMINLGWIDESNNQCRTGVLYHSGRPDSQTDRAVSAFRLPAPGFDAENKLLILRIAANGIEGFGSGNRREV